MNTGWCMKWVRHSEVDMAVFWYLLNCLLRQYNIVCHLSFKVCIFLQISLCYLLLKTVFVVRGGGK